MEGFSLQCEICQKMTGDVARDQEIGGHALCSDCSGGHSKFELMEKLVTAKENLRRLCHEILESTAWELQHLRGEIEKQRTAAHAHLRIVDASFHRSSREEQALRREVQRWASRAESERRQARIEFLRQKPATYAHLEVAYLASDRRYVRRIVSQGRVIETRYFAESRREEIRECIAVGYSQRIPWKRIREEGIWSAEIRLCPFFLDRIWEPQNLLSL